MALPLAPVLTALFQVVALEAAGSNPVSHPTLAESGFARGSTGETRIEAFADQNAATPSGDGSWTTQPLCSKQRLHAAMMDTAWIGGAAALDLWTTERVLAGGGRELHPLMQGGFSRRIEMKLAGTALSVIAADQLRKRGHEREAKLIRWTLVALQLGAAAWNVRQTHQ